ncbi:hypothetical protein NM22_14290 [Vibrio tubiashii]|nr:hypothetical protein NM22_14290 [Vibrio tubiashii]
MDELTLDIRTLNFTVIIFSLIYSSGLFLYQTKQKNIAGLKTLAMGVLLIGVGPALLGLRDQAPDWITIIIANSFIMLGFLSLLYGVSLVREFAIRVLHLFSVGFIIACCLFYYFTYHQPSIDARVIVLSLYVSACCLMSGWALIKGKRNDALMPILIMALPFFAYGLFMLLRAFIVLSGPQITDYMAAGNIHALTYLFCLILLVTISLSMLWINNARLLQSIHHLSLKDPLTGLYNRRVMDSVLPELVEKARKQSTPVSLVMTDIDDFKQINDAMGHVVGDETIESVSSVFTNRLPQSDDRFIIRFGGDEFMIFLFGCDANYASAVIEEIREEITTAVKVNLSDHPCTMSFGIAELTDTDSLDDLVAEADIALYQAKRQGKNQVVIARSNDRFIR